MDLDKQGRIRVRKIAYTILLIGIIIIFTPLMLMPSVIQPVYHPTLPIIIGFSPYLYVLIILIIVGGIVALISAWLLNQTFGGTFPCPKCRRLVSGVMDFCSHCGESLGFENKKKCLDCNKLVEDNLKFCPHCGKNNFDQ